MKATDLIILKYNLKDIIASKNEWYYGFTFYNLMDNYD